MVVNTQPKGEPVTWPCVACGLPICDGDGFVVAYMAEDIASWFPQHTRCDNGGGAYYIDVELVRTHQQLLQWTAHLMGKAWLADSDWSDWLRIIAGEVA